MVVSSLTDFGVICGFRSSNFGGEYFSGALFFGRWFEYKPPEINSMIVNDYQDYSFITVVGEILRP